MVSALAGTQVFCVLGLLARLTTSLHLSRMARDTSEPRDPACNMSLVPTGCLCYRDELISSIRCLKLKQFPTILPDKPAISFEDSNLPIVPVLNYTNLQRLVLYNTSISVISKGAFAHLDALQDLVLSRNYFYDLHQTTFQGLTALISLIIKQHNITTLLPDTLSHPVLPNLRMLDLSDGPLTYIDAATFQCQEQVQFLNLTRNRLSSDLGSFDFLTSLLDIQELDLSWNKIQSLDGRLFHMNRNLNKLHLEGNQIQRITESDFIGLHDLKFLFLSHNHLEFIDSGSLTQLTSLHRLYVEYNDLTTLDEQLLPGDSMERLIVYENPWTCDCKVRWFLNKEYVVKWNRDSQYNWTCMNPANVSGLSLTSVPVTSMQCLLSVTTDSGQGHMSNMSVLIWMGGCIMLILLAGLGAVFLYRYVLRGKMCFCLGGSPGPVMSYSRMNNTKGLILMDEDNEYM